MAYFQNYICRFLVFVIAIQILNMSIDSPNAEMPTGKASHANFNYIDTYVEYIAEVILKFDNAIPESKTRNHKDLQQHKHVQIAVLKFQPLLQFFLLTGSNNFYQSSSDNYAYQFIKEINPPPPKAC
jgi:hypothetical protein